MLPKIGGVCEIPGIKQRARRIFVAAESTIYTYLIQKRRFSLLFNTLASSTSSLGSSVWLKVCFYFNTSCSRVPPDPPRPRDRAKSHPHSSLVIPGERTGVADEVGERRLFKVALPETASNHYIFCWLNGIALDSGQSVR